MPREIFKAVGGLVDALTLAGANGHLIQIVMHPDDWRALKATIPQEILMHREHPLEFQIEGIVFINYNSPNVNAPGRAV